MASNNQEDEVFDPMIPINLRLFCKIFIGDDQRRALPALNIAKFIEILDPDERICHIQYPSQDNNLACPVIWHINYWRQEAEHQFALKRWQNETNAIYNIRSGAFCKLRDALRKLLGPSFDSAVIDKMALDIIERKQVEVAKFHGVDISNIPDRPTSKFPRKQYES